MMQNKNKKLLNICLGYLLFVANARADYDPGVEKISIHNQRKANANSIDRHEYTPLVDVQAAFQLEMTFDPITNVYFILNKRIQASISVGMNRVLINGTLYNIKLPVLYKGGEVFVPFEFTRLLRTESPLPKARESSSNIKEKKASKKEFIPRVIVLDAGHGGKDPGAMGPTGLKEKDINLDIAKRLQRLLKIQGNKVILTRNNDQYYTLKQRAEVTKNIQPDLFISIHVNASSNRKASGIETYYSATRLSLNLEKTRSKRGTPPLLPRLGDLNKRLQYQRSKPPMRTQKYLHELYFHEFYKESRYLAISIQNALIKLIPNESNRGIKPGRWYVVRWSQAPAILVELGFVSSPSTERKMKSKSYREKLAVALLNGVNNYFN